MKKIYLICILFVFISCKGKSAVETSFAIPENAITPEEAAVAQNEATSAKSALAADGSKIDYDLSEMNSNMVYSQVFNMMIEPEIYDDKVIKMRGNFAVYPNSPTANGGTSYAVIISDALACCQQGIEFKYDFGDKLPKEGDIITVTGVYVTAMLPGDMVFNYVKADSVEM
ncbi:hypothetical protein [Treponema ruminis]|uniref:Lipoprotein n=1 Tax=Treponema ruminis TaxID=744515 RepID=A0A7W8G6V4_9SPIR|nr:hypothetical protein [Treponema ruminis]MBB5224934.1 hypothetical protein [Treponema ruminis]